MPMSSRLQVGKSSVVNFRCSSQVASSKNKFPTCPIWRGIRSLDNAGMSCSNCGRASLAFPRTVVRKQSLLIDMWFLFNIYFVKHLYGRAG